MSDRGMAGGEYGFFYLGRGSLTVCEGPDKGRRSQGAAASLMEWEALVGRGLHGEALAVVSRALERGREGGDLQDRLRLARGLALWLGGRVAAGANEIAKVLQRSTQPLTRARALEASGLVAWKAQDLDGARKHLDLALDLYRSAAYGAGTLRVLLKKAGVLREADEASEAQRLVGEAARLASELGRSDLAEEARLGQCALFLAEGLWQEARETLGADAEGAATLEVPRCLLHVALGLAQGDLAGARDSLGRARRALAPDGSDPRAQGEAFLLSSDLDLAAGRPESAAEQAAEAQALFGSLQERDGECRSRIRLAHALLAQGDVALALEEAQRAVKAAPPTRAGLAALSLLTLGRALLRTSRGEAALTFEQSLETSPTGPFAVAAHLGRALARGAKPQDPEITACLAALETWGDRRIFSYCLADLRELCGVAHFGISASSRPVTAADPVAAALVEAAGMLRSAEEWRARWHTVMRSLGDVLPWWRAILVGNPGWELRRDLESPQALSSVDLAAELAALCSGPSVIDLLSDASLRRHPTRVLHGLGAALLAPLGSNAVLYVDVREEDLPLPDHASALLLHLGTLVRPLLAEGSAPEPGEEEAGLFPDLIGRSRVMQDLFAEMRRLAPLDVSVHIFGETGTGKEKVAHALHRNSRRGEGAWVAVNAASLSDELFESELFGHVKGAFTGALADRRGYVAEAEGGTLFLDEVTDLSPRAQAKLLRFLQEREYRRLGETHLARADVRVVTASNVPLEERVSAGLFRSDLMYRLTQTTLVVPPLRERGDDVLLLARHFLRQLSRRAGAPVPALSQEAVRALLRHTWPGNVRELESEVVRVLARAGTGKLGCEHLSKSVAPEQPTPRAPLKQSLLAFERAEIVRALGRHGGNRTRAALDLGLSRQALLAKISRLGIAGPRR